MSTQTTRPVVVGYDDSPAGELALEWAVREADRLDRPLKVVVARGMLWSTSPGFGPAVPGRRTSTSSSSRGPRSTWRRSHHAVR